MNFSLYFCIIFKAEERGRWWVVGSAWQGTGPGVATNDEQQTASKYNFSQQILELARKQRMNTDVRKNVFCILMTAEVSDPYLFYLCL